MNNKQEFLDGLRRALTGKISSVEVEEHIRYYDEYITAEMRKGCSEKEALDLLGNPRLIAMSICDAHKAAKERSGTEHSSDNAGTYYEASSGTQSHENFGNQEKVPFLFRHPKITIALVMIIILIIIGIAIWLAVSLVSFFWPLIVTIAAVALLVRLIVMIQQNR